MVVLVPKRIQSIADNRCRVTVNPQGEFGPAYPFGIYLNIQTEKGAEYVKGWTWHAASEVTRMVDGLPEAIRVADLDGPLRPTGASRAKGVPGDVVVDFEGEFREERPILIWHEIRGPRNGEHLTGWVSYDVSEARTLLRNLREKLDQNLKGPKEVRA